MAFTGKRSCEKLSHSTWQWHQWCRDLRKWKWQKHTTHSACVVASLFVYDEKTTRFQLLTWAHLFEEHQNCASHLQTLIQLSTFTSWLMLMLFIPQIPLCSNSMPTKNNDTSVLVMLSLPLKSIKYSKYHFEDACQDLHRLQLLLFSLKENEYNFMRQTNRKHYLVNAHHQKRQKCQPHHRNGTNFNQPQLANTRYKQMKDEKRKKKWKQKKKTLEFLFWMSHHHEKLFTKSLLEIHH